MHVEVKPEFKKRSGPKVEPRINELSSGLLPEILPPYLFSLERLYQSLRSNIYYDAERGIVAKERLHQFNGSRIDPEEIERIVAWKLRVEQSEAVFYRQASYFNWLCNKRTCVNKMPKQEYCNKN